jgi:hypothetical protein
MVMMLLGVRPSVGSAHWAPLLCFPSWGSTPFSPLAQTHGIAGSYAAGHKIRGNAEFRIQYWYPISYRIWSYLFNTYSCALDNNPKKGVITEIIHVADFALPFFRVPITHIQVLSLLCGCNLACLMKPGQTLWGIRVGFSAPLA